MDCITLRQAQGNASSLRPKNSVGFLWLSYAGLLVCLGVFLSTNSGLFWILGQIIIAWVLVLFFVIMHECGHNTFFKTRKLNVFFGGIAGLISMTPFTSWKHVHWDHHVNTGYRDLDPTTVSTIPGQVTKTQKSLMNFCWQFWIPVFAIFYRIENFWNFKKLSSRYPQHIRLMCAEMLGIAALWIGVIMAYGSVSFFRDFALGFYIAFVIQELVMLSQHSHIPWDVANGGDVQPKPFLEQGIFTRSAIANPVVSKFLFIHFDHHEAHHLYPRVPGYFLNRVNFVGANTVSFLRWVSSSKRIPADVLIYQNSKITGHRI